MKTAIHYIKSSLLQKRFFLFAIFILFISFANSQTSAYFTVNTSQGCVPLSVNFTDSSYGGTVVQRDWDLSGQLTSGLITVGKNFQQDGSFVAKLTVTFSNGDIKTYSTTIVVHPLPIADFSVINPADTAGCVPYTIKLKSLATTKTGKISKWMWDFGAGSNTGIDSTPSFTYITTGNYNVSLVVENSWGCKSQAKSKLSYIHVFPPVKASFTCIKDFSCDTFLLTSFTNTSTGGGALTYYFYFGDGDSVVTTKKDSVISHLYKKPGSYSVKLVARNATNCQSTYILSTNVLVGKSHPSFTTAPDTVCANNSITFNGVCQPAGYLQWIFGDNTPIQYYSPVNHTYTTPGTYTITLIATNTKGCTDTIRKKIVVRQGPQVDFSQSNGNGCTLPFAVTFTAQPTLTKASYSWDFGDGTSYKATTVTANHTYTSTGTFNVRLTVFDSILGCGASIIRSAVKIVKPDVDFMVTPTSGCKPLKVTLKAVISKVDPPHNSVLKYRWEIGNGTTIETTTATVTYTFTEAGTFPIRLILFTTLGCEDSSQVQVVTVNKVCDDDGGGDGDGNGGGSGFIVTRNCSNKYSVDFKDTVQGTQVIKWDFGDGTTVTTGTLNPITHTFPTIRKDYVVQCIRKDLQTQKDDTGATRIIIIDEKANFVPSITEICKGLGIYFRTVGIDSSKIRKYIWDFGDSSARKLIDNQLYYSQNKKYLNGSTSYAYTKNGTYTVKLIIQDKAGCWDLLAYNIPIIIKGPTARLSVVPRTTCGKQLTVAFKDSSIANGSVPITKWEWIFGDGDTLRTTVDSIIHHLYTSNTYYKTYSVKLKITDAVGCEAEDSKTNYIKLYNPKASFYTYDTLRCGNLSVQFYNNSSSAHNESYSWDFGDGTTSTNSTPPAHTYTVIGAYTIRLIVKDENNCTDTMTRNSYVKKVQPKALFTVGDTSACAPISATFINKSMYSTTYKWDFGDGGTGSTDKDPTPHTYGTPGNYTVTLMVKGIDGCVDTLRQRIHIKGPIAKLNYNPSAGCVPYSFGMAVSGSNLDTFRYDFGDGTPIMPVTDSVIAHTYKNSGKYLPNVIITSPEGCPITLEAKDSIIVDEIHSIFSILPYNICDSARVSVKNASTTSRFSHIITTNWNWGDGNTDTLFYPPSHLYNTPGKYTIRLITTSFYGCKDTSEYKDTIKVWRSPKLKIVSDSVFCLHNNSTINALGIITPGDSIANYTWNISKDTLGHTKDLSTNYRKAGSHILTYTTRTLHGCTATTQHPFTIDSVKAAFSVDEINLCGTGTVKLHNLSTASDLKVKYLWDLGDGTFFTGKDTSHFYPSPGTYTIKLTSISSFGCKDSSTTLQPVKVLPQPKASILGDTFRCNASIINYSAKVLYTDSIKTYKWVLDSSPVSSTDKYNAKITPGKHLLKLYIETKEGCKDTIQQNLLIDSVKAGFKILNPYSCGSNDTVRFINTSTSWSGNLQYVWDFGDGQTTTAINPKHLYSNTSANYTVKVIATSSSQCSDTYVLPNAVNHFKAPLIKLSGPVQVCEKDFIQLNLEVTSNDSIQNYYWWLDSHLIDSTKHLHYPAPDTGKHLVRLRINTIHGCSNDTTIQINVNHLPNPRLTKDSTICIGNKIQLQAHDGITYRWSPVDGLDNGFISNPVASPGTTTTYKVNVFSVYGCLASDSVTIRIDTPTTIMAHAPPPICKGNSVALNVTGNAASYKWSPSYCLNNDAIPNPVATLSTTTTFTVVGKSTNACPDVITYVTATVGNKPDLHIHIDSTVINDNSIQLQVKVTNATVMSYDWSPPFDLSCYDCPNPVMTANVNRSYTVTVISDKGCKTTDSIYVRKFCSDLIWIPNAFSPNDDRINDVFYLEAPSNGKVDFMRIFSRWGDLVFERTDFRLNDSSAGWDGTVNGKPVENGNVFSYVIKVTCSEREQYTIRGSITIIK